MIKRLFAPRPDIAAHLSDSLNLGLKIEKMQRLERCLDGFDYPQAAKAGVHPDELDAIRSLRLTGIEPRRIEALLETLTPGEASS